MHKIFVKTKCVVSFNVPFVSRPKKGLHCVLAKEHMSNI